MISNFKFPNNAFVTATVWCIVSLTTILRLLQRKNSLLHFSLICSFYCCLMKECRALKVAAICHRMASWLSTGCL